MPTAQAEMKPRDAALEILTNRYQGLSWRACQFLGQVAGLPDRPLSDRQADWMAKLCDEAGLALQGVGA